MPESALRARLGKRDAGPLPQPALAGQAPIGWPPKGFAPALFGSNC